MISLVMPPKSQIALTNKMLTDEYGTASNIKSRVNRQSVLSAITSAQQRLKLYNRCPANGLVVYCGEVLSDDGKVKSASFFFARGLSPTWLPGACVSPLTSPPPTLPLSYPAIPPPRGIH